MANNASISNISIDLTELSSDSSPQLGGNLDLNSNNITGTGNINTTGTITSSGAITSSGTITGSSFSGDGSSLSGINTDLVSDTTPQLGGNLDLNGNNITGTGNIPAANLTGTLPALDGSNLTGVQAASVDVDESTDSNSTLNVLLSDTNGSGNVQMTPIQDDGGLTFNPGTNLLSAGSLYLYTGGNIILEGPTSNAFETTLQAAAQTADRTITLPNSTGTVRVGYQPGEIIEEINATCDGTTVVVQSGSYTMTNVTSVQNGSNTYTTITGSSISYTPPTGTKRVYYRFWYHFDVAENSGISHHIMQIDGTNVYGSASQVSSNYASTNWHHAAFPISVEYTIDCDASSTSATAGQFTSWTSPKTLRVQYREYSGSYESRIHYNNWWNGSGSASHTNYQIMKPHLTIRAIA